MKATDKAILAALTDLSGIGDARAYDLYTYFDDPSGLLDAPESLADEFHYVDASTLAEIRSLDEELESYCNQFNAYESDGITVLGIEDDQYPDVVRNGPAPVLMYAKGNVELLTETTVGVSGARETNEIGRQWIQSLSSALVDEGYAVVSGGARGADTAAHRGALEASNSTIAVLGTGVNVAYPPENQSLFDQIIDTGGLLVSMRSPDAEPTRHSFLNRNELIAALSDGMIFVATDGSGGTMAQYEMALEQDRPVFAPPPGLGIEPSDGLETFQQSEKTTIIQNVSDLSNRVSTTTSEQMNLDNWS
ncbi:DNA-processing protein DprA [Natronorubrum thiooxidans]|uniref:DNA processing protein n=1 Tax=Natronorubrum thiooxidans TaxID=308853 RepID=A0A1N7H310_9EURY|nr:DNA-processing protein DprA [Natronorubrum thiooxidans]SIS19221.1 DNA processing protein [Natronorubrum thiooxidans]